jgi:hypothetical protein
MGLSSSEDLMTYAGRNIRHSMQQSSRRKVAAFRSRILQMK